MLLQILWLQYRLTKFFLFIIIVISIHSPFLYDPFFLSNDHVLAHEFDFHVSIFFDLTLPCPPPPLNFITSLPCFNNYGEVMISSSIVLNPIFWTDHICIPRAPQVFHNAHVMF